MEGNSLTPENVLNVLQCPFKGSIYLFIYLFDILKCVARALNYLTQQMELFLNLLG